MITSHLNNVDANQYCYETNISFGEEFGKRLLDRILTGEEFLVLEKRYVNPMTNITEMTKKLSFEDGKILGRRLMSYKKLGKPIDFRQYALPPELLAEFLELVPQWIKDIDTFHPVVQISKEGETLPPHRGHQRKSSLFMLLQGNGEQTKWYRETDTFKVFDFLRIPDLTKIENIVTAELEPYKWTMFNHRAWHSVHKFSNGLRINIGLDFDNISAEELLIILKNKNETSNG